MQYNICSISFRHELVSIRDLVRFAQNVGFSGIELWGVHAISLFRNNPLEIARIVKEMRHVKIGVSMISDYIDLLAEPKLFVAEEKKWCELITIARLFNTDKIRIFAGNKAKLAATEAEWQLCMDRLHQLTELSSAYKIYTIVEAHPGTLADSLDATLSMVQEVDNPYLRVNLDFLHLWEAGDAPIEAFKQLKHWVVNFHLKNVLDQDRLQVFTPNNVYSPSGRREGIVPLAEGAVNFEEIVSFLIKDQTVYPASIEWFGNEPFRWLRAEMQWLKRLEHKLEDKSNAILL